MVRGFRGIMPIMLKLSAAAALLAAVVAAQDLPGRGGLGDRRETKHLILAMSASPEVAGAGTRLSLALDISPKPGMHVYAPGQEGYIAVALTLNADPAFTAGKTKYPASETIVMKIVNERQRVYAKPFRITQDVTLASTPEVRRRAAAGGALTIKGSLRYQACDEAVCYLPVTLPIAWTVKLKDK